MGQEWQSPEFRQFIWANKSTYIIQGRKCSENNHLIFYGKCLSHELLATNVPYLRYEWHLLTVMALPWSLWFFSLCSALYASCRLFIQINAQPLGGIKSIDTMSPYSPNVSDSSSWCTNFERCPTQSVVLHTGIQVINSYVYFLYENLNIHLTQNVMWETDFLSFKLFSAFH